MPMTHISSAGIRAVMTRRRSRTECGEATLTIIIHHPCPRGANAKLPRVMVVCRQTHSLAAAALCAWKINKSGESRVCGASV
jgi:hypothetical protein